MNSEIKNRYCIDYGVNLLEKMPELSTLTLIKMQKEYLKLAEIKKLKNPELTWDEIFSSLN